MRQLLSWLLEISIPKSSCSVTVLPRQEDIRCRGLRGHYGPRNIVPTAWRGLRHASHSRVRALYAPQYALLTYTLSSYSFVAVHGLNGHLTKTWTGADTGLCWLKDYLPSDIQNIRIMSYSYNADIAFGNTTASLKDHAIDLLGSLMDEREDSDVSPRPASCSPTSLLLCRFHSLLESPSLRIRLCVAKNLVIPKYKKSNLEYDVSNAGRADILEASVDTIYRA